MLLAAIALSLVLSVVLGLVLSVAVLVFAKMKMNSVRKQERKKQHAKVPRRNHTAVWYELETT